MSEPNFDVDLNLIKPELLKLYGSIIKGSGSIFHASAIDDLTVTVPAPTSAPTLSSGGPIGGGNSANLTGSTSYRVAYTYLAWNGETGLSPVVTFTAVAGQQLAVLPIASLADNSKWAVGAYFYLSDDAGVTWHRANGGNHPSIPGLIAFGDDGVWGGQLIYWNASGAAPPAGAATTTTYAGKTVSVPASAPTVTHLGLIPATTYYGAYAYLCGDGTRSLLSPISSGFAVTTGPNLNIAFRIPNEPPRGAVAVCRYLGTTAAAGSMHLQDTVPLFHVNGILFSYNSGGAVPSAGAAQSVLCGFQQAYSAAIEAGGGEVVASSVETEVPIILHLKNAAGVEVAGVKIRGVGTDQIGANARVAISYVGSASGVVGILVCGAAMTWSDLDFYDPNSKVKYAHAVCDFDGGGGGFQSFWERSIFQAFATDGIAQQISVLGASSSTHIASELFFDGVSFQGKAWSIDIHGGQTGDLIYSNCTFASYGNNNSANSGNIRMASDFNNRFTGMTALVGSSEYRIFVTSDANHILNAIVSMDMSGALSDAGALAPFILYVSSNVADTSGVWLHNNWFQGGDADVFSVFSASALRLSLRDNAGPSGLGWINLPLTTGFPATWNPAISVSGFDNFLSPTVGKVKLGTSDKLDYARIGSQLYGAAQAFTNESGQTSLVKTNATGDIVLTPDSGDVLVPDDAYDGTAWNGSLAVPTKNAIRDKIETPAFTAPSLQNSWVDFGGSDKDSGYLKHLGIVHLCLNITGGTTTNGTLILTLPAGYRPNDTIYFRATTAGGVSVLFLNSSGELIINSGANSYLLLYTSFVAEG